MVKMDPSEISKHYPLLYHIAEAGSWDSISRHGLLSTRSLIDLFEIDGDARDQILRRRRPASVQLHHAVHGTAVVRDQIPLSESRLAACLTDMTLEEWLDALNSRVFFWLNDDHLETLLGARAYRDDEHDVITVDTAQLLERPVPCAWYRARVTISVGGRRPAVFPAERLQNMRKPWLTLNVKRPTNRANRPRYRAKNGCD
jgi:hypothetical protein